jgi:hypothetical protein
VRVKSIIIGGIFVFCLFFVSVVLWIRVNGKAAVERRASLMLYRPVTVSEVHLAFPLVLMLKDVNVEGLLWVKEAQVHCDLLTFFGKKFRLTRVELTDPVLTLHRTEDRQIIWAGHGDGETPVKNAPSKTAGQGHPVEAVIEAMSVVNGQIHFPSHSSEDDAFEFSLSRVHLKAKNVPLSGQAVDVGFDFWGRIEGDTVPFAGDNLKGAGWINWPARNMDATFGVVNPRGKLDVEVNLNARNNETMVRGRLKTRRMNLKSLGPNTESMENLLLDAIHTAGMEVNLEFSFATKMDQWELRNIDFSGNLNAADEGKTQAEKIKDLKNIGQQFRAVGEQIYEKYNKQEAK